MSSFSQDVLYTVSGKKLETKVVEINTTDIKYKNPENLEGPTYVISKSDIVLIQFANGLTQIINPNPPSVNPAKTETVITTPKVADKQKPNLYYLNPNLISINALALANGDVTLMYDRDLLNSHLGISFLGGYNFNSRMGGLNAMIADSKDKAKKLYDAGIGINFMPKNTKRTQYFVGLLGKYMAYNYQNAVDTTNNQIHYESAQGYQLAIMITNGWVYHISPNFNFKIFGSFGFPVNAPELKPEYIGAPKAYLGYCFGYRF
jgi:hypothetical protein